MDITTIGLDLAKHVFQVHGVNKTGHVVIKRRLRRAQVITYFASLPPCLIGMEAARFAVRRGGQADRRDRRPDRGLAQDQPCQPAARHHPGVSDR